MYYLFREHHVMPGEFMRKGYGEKQIIHAFTHYEIDQKNKEAKALKEGR